MIKIIGCPKPQRHPVKTTSWGQGSGRFVDPHVCVPPETPRVPSADCPPRASPLSSLHFRASLGMKKEPDRAEGIQRHQTINPWLNPWSSRAQLWAQQTPWLLCPSGCSHLSLGAPSPGRSIPPAAARGDPLHPTEILAPASEADGDKDKTTPSLINKGPDSAASIRQAIPEPARPSPATKRLHAGIAAGIRQPARGTGSGKRRALLASPFT